MLPEYNFGPAKLSCVFKCDVYSEYVLWSDKLYVQHYSLYPAFLFLHQCTYGYYTLSCVVTYGLSVRFDVRP